MPTRRKFLKAAFFFITGGIFADAFWFEKFFIETKEFYFEDASQEKTNLKLVQISDLHLQKTSYPMRQLAKKINSLRPDLILITGDAIDKARNINLLADFLNLIDKDIKKVAILGNWEYWGAVDLTALNIIYKKNNTELLINRSVKYLFRNTSISITGVDDFLGGNADINAALENHSESDYHIILNHCPQYSDRISETLSQPARKNINVNFILSGHTHGGQINFFGFAPFLPPGSGKYVSGWYNAVVGNQLSVVSQYLQSTFGKPVMYVSKGIGTSIFPVRFGARAEIAIFNL